MRDVQVVRQRDTTEQTPHCSKNLHHKYAMYWYDISHQIAYGFVVRVLFSDIRDYCTYIYSITLCINVYVSHDLQVCLSSTLACMFDLVKKSGRIWVKLVFIHKNHNKARTECITILQCYMSFDLDYSHEMVWNINKTWKSVNFRDNVTRKWTLCAQCCKIYRSQNSRQVDQHHTLCISTNTLWIFDLWGIPHSFVGRFVSFLSVAK